MAELDLDELERIGKAATAGPWERTTGCRIESTQEDARNMIIYDEGGHTSEDAKFIVAARNNWQSMIDEIRRLREQVVRMARWVESLDGCVYCGSKMRERFLTYNKHGIPIYDSACPKCEHDVFPEASNVV